MASQIAKLETTNRSLRRDNKSLASAVDELAPQCFGVWGRFGLMLSEGATAFLSSKAMTKLHQVGVPRFAFDLVIGGVMQAGGALGRKRWHRVVEREGAAMFHAALGRLGFTSQVEKTEVGGRMLLVMPGKAKAAPAPTNGGA